MSIRKALGIIFCIALLITAWYTAPVLRGHLTANHAYFLLVQGEPLAARTQIEKVQQLNPDSLRLAPLWVWLETLSGNYQAAVDYPVNAAAMTDTALYWKTLAAYELGREKDAIRHSSHALRSDSKILEESQKQLLRTLHDSLTTGVISLETPEASDRYSDLEAGIWYSALGRIQTTLGAPELATQSFEQALKLGTQNPKTLYLACKTAALNARYDRAQMWLDTSPTHDKMRNLLFREFYSEWSRYHPAAFSWNALPGQAADRATLAKAAAWATTLKLRRDGSTFIFEASNVMDRLMQEHPGDDVLKLRRAEMLELLDRYQEAFNIYKDLHAETPSYALLLRLLELSGDEVFFHSRSEAFFRQVPYIAHIPHTEMETTGGTRVRQQLAFYQNGEAGGNIKVAAAATFSIILVATGDHAFGLSPMVHVYVDGAMRGEIYVARERWDCYALDLALNAGNHYLELRYVNNSERVQSNLEDRNLYLKEVYVISAEGRLN